MTADEKPIRPGTAPQPVRLLRPTMPVSTAAHPGAASTPLHSRSDAAAHGGAGRAEEFEADPARDAMLAARQGDVEAFKTLVVMFTDRVMRVMTSVLRCDRATAEDLAQEVFLRVHKGLTGFDGEVRFAVWLHKIAMNVAISEYRRRRAQKRDRRTLSIDAPIAGTDDLHITPASRELDPGENAHQREFLARVRECVQQLPDEFRQPVVLRDMESLSYEEIAEVLDLPPGTVRSRIHRGRLLLQKMLAEFVR